MEPIKESGYTRDYPYEKIANQENFKELKRKKNSFILYVSIFFLLAYIALPILTSYTTILNTPVIGDISLVWVYSILLFVMTWTLCMIYVKRANQFDEEAEAIKDQAVGEVVK
ncbi:hypothetical protein CQS04_01805 [Chryseomicrobium excrementi]|uniref:DUF485 domain-containing protein n=1 Tax=Chryseomicrobium excrementi TaxID=2041346 RepID=A0A2M9F2E6_9BACL|nr:DUF485 domain-containing protein [Chryseomicrobium excrementi]PJK17636.1 hypothetical protein CQS04_01805 [Chryseomicrobium excrementi]